MTDLGEYSAEVLEVVRFVERKSVLRTRFDARAITSLPTLTIHAMDGEDVYRFRDPDWPDAKIREQSWSDIKSQDQADFQDAIDKDPHFVDTIWPAVRELSDNCFVELSQCLNVRLEEDEIQEIGEDFYLILLGRAAYGAKDTFIERLYSVYRASGYPCGWAGKYPEGKLVVYSRE